MKYAIILAASLLSFSTIAQVKNIESKGNLESPNPATCTEVSKLSNKQNPADIFVGIADCIANNKYELAVPLFMTALGYGKFDTQRVADKSAHQAVAVIRINTLGGLNEDQNVKFQSAFETFNTGNGKIKTCKQLKALGAPSYHPRYMIQHGMGAFNGSKKELVDNFNSQEAWQDVFDNYLKCKS